MNFSDICIRFRVKFYFGNHILHIFSSQWTSNGRQVVQVKAKNPKTDEYLKWKITWEIGKFDFLKNLHVGDFVFGSDQHLVVHRRHSHKKIRSI